MLGPLFIALLFFETTKRFFESWIAQMANYAFITILTVLVSALMLTLLSTAAQQAVSAGGGITIAHAVRVCMAAGLTFLVMRQVMPMAAGLASGLALSTFGAVSAALAWGMGRASRSIRGVLARGVRGSRLIHGRTAWHGKVGVSDSGKAWALEQGLRASRAAGGKTAFKAGRT